MGEGSVCSVYSRLSLLQHKQMYLLLNEHLRYYSGHIQSTSKFSQAVPVVVKYRRTQTHHELLVQGLTAQNSLSPCQLFILYYILIII